VIKPPHFRVRVEHPLFALDLERRYSQFVTLADRLAETTDVTVPALPPKHPFSPQTDEFLEARARGLNSFLAVAVSLGAVRSSKALRSFLELQGADAVVARLSGDVHAAKTAAEVAERVAEDATRSANKEISLLRASLVEAEERCARVQGELDIVRSQADSAVRAAEQRAREAEDGASDLTKKMQSVVARAVEASRRAAELERELETRPKQATPDGSDGTCAVASVGGAAPEAQVVSDQDSETSAAPTATPGPAVDDELVVTSPSKTTAVAAAAAGGKKKGKKGKAGGK